MIIQNIKTNLDVRYRGRDNNCKSQDMFLSKCRTVNCNTHHCESPWYVALFLYVNFRVDSFWQILKSSICNIPDTRASWLNLLRQMVSSHSGIPVPSCRCGSTGGISGTIPIGDRRTFPGRRRHRVTLLSAHQASPPYKRESLVRLPADIIFKF